MMRVQFSLPKHDKGQANVLSYLMWHPVSKGQESHTELNTDTQFLLYFTRNN